MDDNDPRLLTDEKVVFNTRKHWFAPVADSGLAILMIIGAIVLLWLQSDQTTGVIGFVNRLLNLGAILLSIAGVVSIIYNVLAWKSASYAVTNRRLIGQDGLLRKRETDSLLTSISDVRMRQSAVGRMLGYGDIQILSASGESGTDTFTTVLKSMEFKKAILEQKVGGEATGAARAPAAASTPSGPTQNEAVATLNSLAALRDSGAITAEEYEAKKKDLLARI